jgi:hypothetical protein
VQVWCKKALRPSRLDPKSLIFNRWEVVQLVGLQTLDLAILVRVQASQPNLFNNLQPLPTGGNPCGNNLGTSELTRQHLFFEPRNRIPLRFFHRLNLIRKGGLRGARVSYDIPPRIPLCQSEMTDRKSN